MCLSFHVGLPEVASEVFKARRRADHETQVKQNNISSFKAKNSKQSNDDWEFTLSSIFLEEENEESKDSLEGIEAITEIVIETVKKKEVKSLHITIQKRIEGITVNISSSLYPE